MAVGSGITEIPDSEDEPLTSSPNAALSGVDDKLYETPQLAVQAAQDSTQEVANPDQATTERFGNDTTNCVGNLDVDQENASINDQTSHTDRLMPDAQPVVTTQQQSVVETSSDHAPAQTEVLPQLRCNTSSTTEEQRDLLVPQAQMAGFAGCAPAAEQQFNSAVGIDSTDLANKTSEELNPDVSIHDDIHTHPDHGPSSGLLGDGVAHSHGEQPDQSNPDDDMKYDNLEAIVGQRQNSLNSSQYDKSLTAPLLSDAVISSNEPSAVPVVEAAMSNALPRTWVESGDHDDAEHLTSSLASAHATDSPTTDTTNILTSEELQPMKDGDFEAQNKGSTQTNVIASSQAVDNARVENIQTQEETRKSTSAPVGHIANITPQSSAGATIITTETTAFAFLEPPEAQKVPATVASPATEDTIANDSNITYNTYLKGDEQNNDQQTISVESKKRSLDVLGSTAAHVQESESLETSAGVLAKDKANHESEPSVVATTDSDALATTTDKSKTTVNSPSVSDSQPHGSPAQAPPTLTPQEVALAELKAQKSALLASLATLPAIRILMEEKESSDVDMSDNDHEPTEADVMAAVNRIVKDHIKLLHEYNELKDIGQGLMGLIADQRGVRIVEVQDEFGIDAND